MKAYMGESFTLTVCAADLQGIRLALTMAPEDWDRENRRKKLIIYMDSQAAIRATGNLTSKFGAYIVADIIHPINGL